jgi:hypothetical protein
MVRTVPGDKNSLMSMLSKFGGLRPTASQSIDHL